MEKVGENFQDFRESHLNYPVSIGKDEKHYNTFKMIGVTFQQQKWIVAKTGEKKTDEKWEIPEKKLPSKLKRCKSCKKK